MLGLRSLYFLMAGVLDRFRYVRIGLAAILAFVGGKMLLGEVVEVPTWASLVVILGALTVAVTASIARPVRPAGLTVTGERAAPIPPSP
jgi:tellurite resistance protein TerC